MAVRGGRFNGDLRIAGRDGTRTGGYAGARLPGPTTLTHAFHPAARRISMMSEVQSVTGSTWRPRHLRRLVGVLLACVVMAGAAGAAPPAIPSRFGVCCIQSVTCVVPIEWQVLGNAELFQAPTLLNQCTQPFRLHATARPFMLGVFRITVFYSHLGPFSGASGSLARHSSR